MLQNGQWEVLTDLFKKMLAKRALKSQSFILDLCKLIFFKKAGNDYDTSTGLEVEKVAKAIEYIINCDEDVIIPELGIKNIENC